MAYNNYFPQYYPNQIPIVQAQQQMPLQQPTMLQNGSQASSNGINWVQGESAAKSFPVGAGQSVLLMDSEESTFYIKSTDASGMPQPLRIFDYTERSVKKNQNPDIKDSMISDYVSRSEFDEFREDVKRSLKGMRRYEEGEADG